MIEENLRKHFREFHDLELLELVGSGSFGEVYKAHHTRLGIDVAIKLLLKNLGGFNTQAQFQQEAQLMARIDHPNVLRIYDIRFDPQGAFLVLEWMDDGDLIGKVKDEEELRTLTIAITSGLQALHRVGVIHRDIKPANILRRKDSIKIADLGIAFLEGEEAGHLVCGTPDYMAPELFTTRPPSYSTKSDLFSLGALLYELWTGRPPFIIDDIQEWRKNIHNISFEKLSSIRPGLSNSFTLLIHALLSSDPELRPSSEDILVSIANQVQTRIQYLPKEEQPLHSTRIGPWFLGKQIYLSSNWECYSVYHAKTGLPARLNILQKNSNLPASLILQSAKQNAQWSHPGLTPILDWGMVNERAFIVFGSIGLSFKEYIENHGVMDELGALALIERISSGLEYMHEQGFVYQMVEPGSIYFDPTMENAILGWSCFCVSLNSSVRDSRIYVPLYSAPEVRFDDQFRTATDIYGLGILLYFALTGKAPSKSIETQNTELNELRKDITAHSYYLLLDLLNFYPEKRPSAAVVVQCCQRISSILSANSQKPKPSGSSNSTILF